MNKIGLIIKREYLTRVKKRSFILLTLLGPLLMAGTILFITWLGMEERQQQHLLVIDDKYPVFEVLENTPEIIFDYQKITLEQAKDLFHQSAYTGILYLPNNIEHSNIAMLYFKKQPSLFSLKIIENKVEKVVEDLKLQTFDINREVFDKVNTNFHLTAVKYTSSGKEEAIDEEKSAVGFVFGLFIYFFIFMYGVQVMRGVIEEKTNRIVEVIVSSVKPFQLMMGKIIGVALVGLTQFLIWIGLTFLLYSIAISFLIAGEYGVDALTNSNQMSAEMMNQLQGQEGLNAKELLNQGNIINRINFPLMLSMFAFYFLGGYLLYSALFAAVGSAVDTETDTQQFMLPVTLPLIAAYLISIFIVQNPEGPAAFWFSIIPFTSPIVMMVRLAIGVGDGGIPIWELGLSMSLLIAGFIFTTWVASKIYRIGILSYGKKPSFKDLSKWMTRKL